MEDTCVDCHKTLKPQGDSHCGVCESGVCRKCRIFLAEEEFPFVPERPAELKHTYYCGACNDQHVAPFRAEYETAMEKAKDVNVIYRDSKSSLRVLRKAPQMVRSTGFADRDEAILKLAFEAARAGFNALIEVTVQSQKLRNAGWQKTQWSAQGVPAEIHSHELKF